MRILLRAVIIVAVLSVEVYALYAALHPRISADYRAYYIERSTSDWNPPHYAATPEQGIDFAHTGWPDFVRNGYGFSYREADGRWTDAGMLPAPRIEMNRQFSGPICLALQLQPSYAETGHQLQVALGNSVGTITLAPEFTTYHVNLNSAQPADSLQFRFDGRIPEDREARPGSIERRRLGVKVASLQIMSSSCPQGTGAH